MTGSANDAEDLVQETWLRWQGTSVEEIRSPKAFLTTVLTRLAINHMQSASVRREEYVGEWLPEPLITAENRDSVELAESLQMAFLVLLESLSPSERAVFLLSEVFDYSHAEVAGIVGKSEEACRQMLRRAKQALSEKKPRFTSTRQRVEEVTERFISALQGGSIDDLMVMLHEDVVVYSDGGGRTQAAINPIHGRDRVTRFLMGITRKRPRLTRYGVRINGQPGVLGFTDGLAETAFVFDFDDDRVRKIYIVVNPDKLQGLPAEENLYDSINSSTTIELSGRVPGGLSCDASTGAGDPEQRPGSKTD